MIKNYIVLLLISIYSTNVLSCEEKSINIFVDEITRRVEKVFLLGNNYYDLNKKELKYWISKDCVDDSLALRQLNMRLSDMGYGVSFSQEEIRVCKYEKDCILDNNSIVWYIGSSFLSLFIIVIFLLKRK